ncbi:hypothetical protein DFH09DRAFT_1072891 [Mycena vulgaris]|nr:hypothetical protein DFH09DRAFT_1072891 [Mycena vulgaris]
MYFAATLNNLVLGTTFIPVPAFTPGTPPTPEELAAATSVDAEAQHYWVVLRGPQAQLVGVPHSFHQRKSGRKESLTFYAANYPAHVRKWIQVPAPVPGAAATPDEGTPV